MITSSEWRIRLDESNSQDNYKSVRQVIFMLAGSVVSFAENVDSTSDSGHLRKRTAFYAYDGFESIVSKIDENTYCSDGLPGASWAAVKYSNSFSADSVVIVRPSGPGGESIAPTKFCIEVNVFGDWVSVLEVSNANWSFEVSKAFNFPKSLTS